MPVMITRRKAIELGEQAVERFVGVYRGNEDAPEVAAFRVVLATGERFARGGCETNDGAVTCPMRQTGLWNDPDADTREAFNLAMCWDDVTFEAGLGYGQPFEGPDIIEVNPLTVA